METEALDLSRPDRVFFNATVRLGGEEVVLSVTEPRKALADLLDAREGDRYALAAAVLSCNAQGVEVTPEQAEGALTEEGCVRVLRAYDRKRAEGIEQALKA